MFLTVDTTTLKPRVLGSSFFPLFIDSETKAPVLAKDKQTNLSKIKRALHTGAYQMPIYYELPRERKGQELVTYKDYIQLERIPTASVLLRVDYASIDNDGNFISIKSPDPELRQLAYYPPPDYNTGRNSTLYYLISDEERDLYAMRKQRNTDLPLSEVLLAVT